jgi:hypothetical protein
MGDSMDISLIGDAAAWAGFIVALASFWYARKAFLLTESQAKYHMPDLKVYLHGCHFERNLGVSGRHYGIHISISNPSSLSNSVNHIELGINYKVDNHGIIPLKIPCDESQENNTGENTKSTICPPLTLNGGQSAKGWCYFSLRPGILPENGRISDETLFIFDNYEKIIEIPLTLMVKK